MSRRAPVPELPRSSTSAGSLRPPTPRPIDAPDAHPRRAQASAPRARMAAAVRSTSSPSSRPWISVSPDGQRAQHQRAVRDRLVARHAGGSGERAGGSGHEWLQDGDTPCGPLGRPWPARRTSLDSLQPGRASSTPRAGGENYLLTGPADHGNCQPDFWRPLLGGGSACRSKPGERSASAPIAALVSMT